MKVALFGATGATGRLVLEQALSRGHTVTALVRTPSKLTVSHERLRVIQGDVTDPAAVEAAVTGQEVVISAIGSKKGRPPTTLYSDSMRILVAAMEKQGVQRLLSISAGGAYPGKDPNAPWFLNYLVKPLIARGTFTDMSRMEEVVTHSHLDWTIIRPSRLVNKPATGKYRRELAYTIKGGNTIGRADLAAFMVGQMDTREYVGKAVAVAY